MNTLLVTAYTPGYADLAERLRASCLNLGLDLCGHRYESTGKWENNGHVKPYVMMRAMLEYPLRPVCWVDADAIVRKVPEELDKIDAGFAFHTVPKTNETLSGTVWTRSMTFLLAWSEWLEGHPGEWDQRALPWVAQQCERMGYFNLPAEYCWVDYFAEKRWGGPRDPVIEHTQASRDVRAGKRQM